MGVAARLLLGVAALAAVRSQIIRVTGAEVVRHLTSYSAVSAGIGTRHFGPGRWRTTRPEAGVASGQLAISSFDWALVASILYVYGGVS